MLTNTNTTGVDFILNVLQGALQSAGDLSTNSLSTNGVLPIIQALESQSALVQSGRVPGGQAYLKGGNGARIAPGPTGAVAANTNAGVVMVGGFETRASQLGTAKAGAFVLAVNASAVTVSLTNTATNTNGQAGDTVFANWNQLVLYNPSGLGIDGLAAATVTVLGSNTNGANLGVTPANALGGYTIPGNGGIALAQNWNANGTVVNAANTNFTVNSTGPVNFVMLICGK